MHVVALDAVVQQSESFLRRLRECCSRGGEDVVASKRRKRLACAERHMDRTAAIVRGATGVRHPTSARRRLAPRPTASPAPGGWRWQLQLSCSVPHLESAHITISLLACQVVTPSATSRSIHASAAGQRRGGQFAPAAPTDGEVGRYTIRPCRSTRSFPAPRQKRAHPPFRSDGVRAASYVVTRRSAFPIQRIFPTLPTPAGTRPAIAVRRCGGRFRSLSRSPQR